MATPKVYVICDQNCKFEGMTKEQILTAITQAVNEGTISNIDTGFVQTIKTINGKALRFFVGEQYEYDALTDDDKKDLFAIITNESTRNSIENAIEALQTTVRELTEGLVSGDYVVERAKCDRHGQDISKTYAYRNEIARHIDYYVDEEIYAETDYDIGEAQGLFENVSTICLTVTSNGCKRQFIGVRSGAVNNGNGFYYIDFVVTGGGTAKNNPNATETNYVNGIGFVQLKEKSGELYLNVKWSSCFSYPSDATSHSSMTTTRFMLTGAGNTLECVSILYSGIVE